MQIAGRAGRFGHHDIGYIGALNSHKVLHHIDNQFHSPNPTIKPPFGVKATAFQIEQLSNHLQTKQLHKILNFFSTNMKFSGPFEAANIKSMVQIAKILDESTKMNLEEKFLFAQAPVSINSPLIKSAFMFYVRSVQNKQTVKYRCSFKITNVAKTEEELLKAEDEIKKIALYLWLSYKFQDYFPDSKNALEYRTLINKFIEKSLKTTMKTKDTYKTQERRPRRRFNKFNR